MQALARPPGGCSWPAEHWHEWSNSGRDRRSARPPTSCRPLASRNYRQDSSAQQAHAIGTSGESQRLKIRRLQVRVAQTGLANPLLVRIGFHLVLRKLASGFSERRLPSYIFTRPLAVTR